MVKQFTKEQAIEFFDDGAWEIWTPTQCFWFQWEQDKLCIPFDKFHEGAEIVLGRSVWTHEFAFREKIQKELDGKSKPTMEEIINLLPAEKTILLSIGEK